MFSPAFKFFTLVAAIGFPVASSNTPPSPKHVDTPSEAICLYQTDFAQGTYIIDQPGQYRLCEDITFKPNPPEVGQSPAEAFQPDYTVYDEKNYGLGFFAAIAIEASGVDLFLDECRLEQSPEHALMQRFFALIELGSSPFLPGVGPHDFGALRPATNVRILGPGKIGLSSHHGIHGNNNAFIEVRDVDFQDFEVAAVSLNNVDDLIIQDNKVLNNRREVPIVGMFSAAVFISKYGKYLADNFPNSSLLVHDGNGGVQTKSSVQLYQNLIASIDAVYYAVINGVGAVEDMYRNPLSVVDGPCYAFLVHGKGPAVNGFGEVFSTNPNVTSSNIIIEDNVIENMQCWTKEIPAAVVDGKVQNDARGAIFQLYDTFTGAGITLDDETSVYVSNPVADMQLFVSQEIENGSLPTDNGVLQTSVNTLSSTLNEWARLGTALDPSIRCNGDSMHHVGKGIVVIRVEDTTNFLIRNNRISHIDNLSVAPFSACDDYHALESSENAGEPQMGYVRGISIASFSTTDNLSFCEARERKSLNIVEDNDISGFSSTYPTYKTIGIDVQGQGMGAILQKNTIDLIKDDHPNVIGVRVRANTDGVRVRHKKLIDEGVLFEEEEVEGEEGTMRRLEVAGSAGCPFATGRAYDPASNPHFGSLNDFDV